MLQANTISRTVYLKDYPKFWERLRIAANRYPNDDAEEIIQKEYGINVVVRPSDKAGTVMMDDPTFTWFALQWS